MTVEGERHLRQFFELVADYEGMGLTLGPHPLVFHRARLARLGVARAADLREMRHGAPVRVGRLHPLHHRLRQVPSHDFH